MSAEAGRELETSQTPWDVAAEQEAALSWGWKDKWGKGSAHMDSDKGKRRERGSREARTLLLPRLKQRLLPFLITECDALRQDRSICLLLLITGECTYRTGEQISATQTWMQQIRKQKIKPKKRLLPNQKDDISQTKLCTPWNNSGTVQLHLSCYKVPAITVLYIITARLTLSSDLNK